MCKYIQYVFSGCWGDTRTCTGNIEPVNIEPCEQAAAQEAPPWQLGYDRLGLHGDFCIPDIEYRYIRGRCSEHESPLSDEDGVLQRYDPRSPVNNVFESANSPQDDYTWHVEEAPWTNVLYRETDWNPVPRPVSLDPPQFSPGDRTEYTHPPVGVQNAAYDPAYWRSADGRPVRRLQTPADPPATHHPRPPMPTIPDDFAEQLDALVAGYRDRQSTPESSSGSSSHNGESSSDHGPLQGAHPEWQPPPISPPGWEPESPTPIANSARQSSKRPRSESEDQSPSPSPSSISRSSPDTPNKRPKVMLRFPNFAKAAQAQARPTSRGSDGIVPTTPQQPGPGPGPLKHRLKMPSKPTKPKLTLQIPQGPRQVIMLRFRLPAKSTISVHGKSGSGNGAGSGPRTRASNRSSQSAAIRPAQAMQGPMTRSRLRQLQLQLQVSNRSSHASQPTTIRPAQAMQGPMTRSRLRQLQVHASQPGNQAKMDQLEAFLRHANGVSR
ncbi:hypothetical protein A1O1_06168 [Capronia coronata CBS 617.96]|uniref:Uncharacterized protein n=1 Tax=Capronia coronata CBS 617.96 TaxID=1182541 RepID=W9YU40_9EURO|nr:uncharacterized protein A1O1_06168 [Capronia coronata CBS 617.96]EXJ85799.1 hypothetical protein A1O1_06168 [Capronia coronata CBS 617.96]